MGDYFLSKGYMAEEGVLAINLQKYYGSFHVLKDINLTVARGTIYGMIQFD